VINRRRHRAIRARIAINRGRQRAIRVDVFAIRVHQRAVCRYDSEIEDTAIVPSLRDSLQTTR